MKKLFLLFVIILLSVPVFAQRTVVITSNIDKSEVFIDGFKAGVTPLELSESGVFGKGSHKVSVKSSGYKTVEREIQFFNTDSKVVDFRLESAPDTTAAPMISSKTMWPLLGPLGLGGIAGWCVGYASKKMAKLAAIFIGIVFICIQLLAFNDMITVNWTMISGKWDSFTGSGGLDNILGGFMGIMTANLPFAGAFAAGFFLGFKKG